MATYTADQLKDYTSVPAVPNWSDDKILLYQSMAETMLDSLELDESRPGYSTAYNTALVAIFDWMADNPTGLKAITKGKVQKTFMESMPPIAQQILKPYLAEYEGFEGASLVRSDIGRR